MNTAEFLANNKAGPWNAWLPNPERTLRQLLADRLSVAEASLFAFPETVIPAAVSARLAEDLADLERGKPEAYVFGTIPFLDWEFQIDERALIPRPETEALCDRLLRSYRGKNPERDKPDRILDLCCGSGVMGLALALAFPQARLVATDLCQRALALAAQNTARFGLEGRVRLERGHLWDAVPPEMTFALIVANPPYVAAADQVEEGVLNWEPATALHSNDQGSAHIKEIIQGLAGRLNPGGLAAFEVGHNHAAYLSDWLSEQDLPGSFSWQEDPFGVTRYLLYAEPLSK